MRKTIVKVIFLAILAASLSKRTLAEDIHSDSSTSNAKLGYRLRDSLDSFGSGDIVNLWIFFTDKGIEKRDKGFRDPSEFISKRAARRRLLRSSVLADWYDVPVNPGYIAALHPYINNLRHLSRFLNAVSALVEVGRIGTICSLPFVKQVELVGVERIPMDVSVHEAYNEFDRSRISTGDDPFGGSFDQLEQLGLIELLKRGYNGSGTLSGNDPITVAILDTGFKREHRALKGVNVLAEWDFVNDDSVTSNEPGDPFDQDFHGTLVLGTIAGHDEGNLIGPAWGANYLLAKTEIVDNEIVVEEDNWIAGIEWADSAGADIVTSSLGYFDWYSRDQLDGNTAFCTRAADIAVSHGIVVVNSAGNRGQAGLVAPADGDSVIAVGAVDKDGMIASFSSRGPTADGRIKPDLTAMGVDVYTVSYSDTAGFHRYNGTSFSAPLVAGSCALLLAINCHWTPMDLLSALKKSATRVASPDNSYGWGIPDVTLASGINVPGYRSNVTISSIIPNPFDASMRLDIFAPRSTDFSVKVYDCSGRCIRTLCSRRSIEWNDSIVWDGRDDNGNRAAQGVYFVSIETSGRKEVKKAVLLY
ncbi:MAG: hypothetical protein B6D63_02495 [Candidatus Latescibacteria bacterium 4484_7]|nr:MAG: hypothetical protein B6D63_02495 [Candidatus Latescibacteria bacterium 4484_7]